MYEGYARAFQYLATKAGIESVLMQADAVNSDGKRLSHAWNAVVLNGKWYLIHTTWDDPAIFGSGNVLESIHYKYFLKGTKTFDQNHFLSKKFTDNDKAFDFSTISIVDY